MTYWLRLVSLGFPLLLALAPGLAPAAGNVTAVNKNGSLVLTGDDDPNGVLLDPGGSADEIVVSGSPGTLINGFPLGQAIGGITRNVSADLGDGSDALVLNDVQLPNRLLVKLGTGDDGFDFTDGSVAENVSVQGGKGEDEIAFSTMSIGRNLQIKSEGDPDTVALDLVTVGRNTTLTTGDGDDTVFIGGDSQLNGRLKINTDRGLDQVELADSTVVDKLGISLGSEDDAVALGGVTTDDAVLLDGGAGVDTYTDDGGNAFSVAPVLKKIEIVN